MIKIRAKRKDNKEWVFGNYYKDNVLDVHYIRVHLDNDDEDFDWSYEIIPETIGRYVELNDVNGVEIYEGDILDYRIPINAANQKGIVVYANNRCAYIIKGTNYMPTNYNPKVVGNIHDNLDMLKR